MSLTREPQFHPREKPRRAQPGLPDLGCPESSWGRYAECFLLGRDFLRRRVSSQAVRVTGSYWQQQPGVRRQRRQVRQQVVDLRLGFQGL